MELAARYDFGNQTEALVHDIFVLNMNNKQVQKNYALNQNKILQRRYNLQWPSKMAYKDRNPTGIISQESKIKEEPISARENVGGAEQEILH